MGVIDAVLGVDGGGTKTDLVVASLDGAVLARERERGTLPQHEGVDVALDRLGSTIRRLTGLAGAHLVHGTFFLSGADYPEETEALARAVAARGWAESSTVDNDAFAVLRAGVEDGAGIAVVCGTGINCVGRNGGAEYRYPAIGHLSGDWGGGAELAMRAWWAAVRGEDGRGEETALSAAVRELCGTASVAEAVKAVHLGGSGMLYLRQLTPMLFECAAGGDPVSLRLVELQAEEIALLVGLAARRISAPDGTPLALGGSVLAADHPALMGPLRARLAPGLDVRVVTDAPVLGAVFDALDRAGAAPGAYARLRRGLRDSGEPA